MKISNLEHSNINLKLIAVLVPLTLLLLSFFILNFQLVYSQSSENGKSLNCKDNKDQSQYISNVSSEVKSNGGVPVTNDLPGFHYVKKFDSNGTLVSAWGTKGTGPGEFLHAHGIAVDSEGNVYVSDAEKCNIQKFDSEGKFITMWGSEGRENGQFIKPWGVAVDSSDNVYTSDQDSPEVQKFNNDGKFLTKWNSYSPGRLFVHLHDITVDTNDSVYVTDGRNNSRVAKFDSQGEFITQWGAFGSGNGRFIEDHGIATDKSGNVFVVDTRNVRIQKFNNQGDFVEKWGTVGCGDNQFLIPHDIAIDASGNVYVSDSGNVHFLEGDTCQSIQAKNWTTTIRKIYASTITGENQVPPTETDVSGRMSIIVPQDESELK
ncbi:MAG: 6-bladed beta-propeller, partial [Nitrososphaeraceae archaeon]|nr:6-bladed beta-propeller [Nitrososphaeraceae archaeon]